MKDLKEFTLTRALLLCLSLAIPSFVAATWTPVGSVTAVYSHGSTQFIQTNIAEAACGTAGKFYWMSSDAEAQSMLAISLTALTADKKVGVEGNFVSPTCLYGGAMVSKIVITST